MRLGVRKTNLLRAAALALVAVGAGACSSLPSVPDWVDPTTWFGDDSNSADNAQTPDLAGLPDKPKATPADEQHQVTESLAADRSHAEYSADALRGGTEAAAAPPPNVAPAQVADGSEETAAMAAKAKAGAKPAAAPPPVQVASVDRSVAQEPTGSSMAGTLPATPSSGYAAAEPPPEPVQTASAPEAAPAAAPEQSAAASEQPASAAAAQAAPQPAAVRTATAPEAAAPIRPKHRHARHTAVAALAPSETASPPAGAQPALPPVSAAPQQMASVSPSDAALGFKPSTAPPLDPSISQFVAAPIIEHYRETAGYTGASSAAAPVAVASARHAIRRLHRPARQVAEGGPEHMTGAVVANLETLTPTTAPAPTASAYANPAGLPASTVVFFPGDIVGLNAEARTQVRAVVDQYRAGGGQGFIRVVGHSSSRTVNMSPERHMEIIFRKSQDRANAVAQEIIREGVPAAKVLVEAVGDSQPVYYESMPKGEDGNRRVEIFLQS